MLAYDYNINPQTLGQEGHELEASPDHIVRPSLKRNKRQN